MKKKNIVRKKQDFDRIISKKEGKATKYFIINTEKSKDNETKFGITFVKNIGNAVTRNKLKRRIKSIIDNNDSLYDKEKNYVIIARKETIGLSFKELEKELSLAFNKVNKEKSWIKRKF